MPRNLLYCYISKPTMTTARVFAGLVWLLCFAVSLGQKSLLLKQNPFSGGVHVDLIPYHLMTTDPSVDYVTRIQMPNGDTLEIALEHQSSWSRKLLSSFSTRAQGYPDASRRQIAQTIMGYYRVDTERWKRSTGTADGSSDSASVSMVPLGGRLLADYELLKLGYLRASLVHNVDDHAHSGAFAACKQTAPLASVVIAVVHTKLLDTVQEDIRAASLGADNPKNRLAHKTLPYWLTLAPVTRVQNYSASSFVGNMASNDSVAVYEIWSGLRSHSAWSELSMCIVDYTGTAIRSALQHNQPGFAVRTTGKSISFDATSLLRDDIRVSAYYRVDQQSPFWRKPLNSLDAFLESTTRGYIIQRSSMAVMPLERSQILSLETVGGAAVCTKFDASTGQQISYNTSYVPKIPFVTMLQINGMRQRSGKVSTQDAASRRYMGSDLLRHAASHYVYDHTANTITVIWSYAPGVFQIDAREAVLGIILTLLIMSRLFGSDFYRKRSKRSLFLRNAADASTTEGTTNSTGHAYDFASNSLIVMFRYHFEKMHTSSRARGTNLIFTARTSSDAAWHRRFVVDVVQYVLDYVIFVVGLGIVIWKFASLEGMLSETARPVALFFYVESVVAIVVGLVIRPVLVLSALYMEQRLDSTYSRFLVAWTWILQAFVFESSLYKSERTQRQLDHNRVSPGHASLVFAFVGDYAFAVLSATAFCALFGWDRARLFNFGVVTVVLFLALAYLLYLMTQVAFICIIGLIRPLAGHKTPWHTWTATLLLLCLVAAKIAVFHETHFVTWAFSYTSGLYSDAAIRVLLATPWVFVATFSLERCLHIIFSTPN